MKEKNVRNEAEINERAAKNKEGLLRWVKAGSKYIARDTEVCEGITIIRGRFITIYGD